MTEPFVFNKIDKQFAFLKNREILEKLQKWNLELKFNTFNYDKPADEIDMARLIQNFFEDEKLLLSLQMDRYVNKIDVRQLNTDIMSMDFFDILYKASEPPVLRQTGHIVGCPPDVRNGVAVEDELRKMLLDEESENYDLFKEDEREELIFELFSSLVLGGPLCQYEDEIDQYFETTKTIYKDLVAIKQNSAGVKDIRTAAFIVDVQKQKNCISTHYQPGGACHPHQQTKMFFLVDPFYRHITIMSHEWPKNAL
ncbi:unnamed protein product [Oikopleura dioica]|uniref:Cilia- and flagella-associated protein 300 n=1 Tax=Oikopleura dioica TaxID=34765 RepID=E4YGF2_OIKDI|nr:unnamed protein product [Oikopleura dioica]